MIRTGSVTGSVPAVVRSMVECALEQFGPRAIGATPTGRFVLVDGLEVFGGRDGLGRRGSDLRAPLAGRSDHACALHGVVARWRDAHGEAAKKREMIHLDGDGAIGEGPLEGDGK